MEALTFLKKWATDYPSQAAFILGGVALFAAVAVVTKFGVNLESSIPSAAYILIAGVVVWLVAQILNDNIIRQYILWFITLLFFCWITVFFTHRLNPEWREVECAALFWLPCRALADQAAPRAAPRDPAGSSAIITAPPASARTTAVTMQFAGFNRDDIKVVMQSLAKAGWNMQGTSQGGQRTASAADVWEIRYPANAKPTADALAEGLRPALEGAKLRSRPIPTKQNRAVDPGTIEIWISQ